MCDKENTKTPLVSVIVPVYNAEKTLQDTVASILAQTQDDFEILLVNDQSSDGSEAIMRAMQDPRIRLLTGEGGSAANARNKGVMEARGRYIAYLDSDDYWCPEKLEKTLSFMQEKDCAFAFTSYEFADVEGNGTGKVVKVPETLTYKKALSRTVIFTSTVIFDLHKLTKQDIMMPAVKSEDTALWWKLLKSGTIAYGLNENLVRYRTGAKSLSSNKVEAVKRIWNLYGMQGDLNFFQKLFYLFGWALRAVVRRV